MACCLPVSEPTLANNGLVYQSNPKHTPGGNGFRPNAGIEPKNSFELFENSIPTSSPKTMLAIDQDGNIHRFFSSNKDGTGTYHWSGSTGYKVPLGHKELGDFIQELKLLKGKL